MTDQQDGGMPQAPALPPGRAQSFSRDTAWTPQQIEILEEVRRLSAGNKTIRWGELFRDNPEWKSILLAGGRPRYHLWHVSSTLLSGQPVTGPYSNWAKRGSSRPTGRRTKSKRGRAWWVKQGLPHPGSKEAREAKAAQKAESAEAPLDPQADFINFCPKCGHCVAHYKKVDKLIANTK